MNAKSRLVRYLMVLAIVLFPFTTASASNEYPLIDWLDLIPADDLEALRNPPSYLDQILDGSIEDQINNQMSMSDDPYQRALRSTKVREEYDGRKGKIPGYIVPLEFNDEMVITEFFLVPYFGACIHLPPPPPNQIIHVYYDKGLELESLYDAFYIEGTLQVQTSIRGDMGTSAYSLEVSQLYPYSE